MGKFTKETYAIVPSSVLENDVMSLGAKGLYSLLKSKPEDWIFDIKILILKQMRIFLI